MTDWNKVYGLTQIYQPDFNPKGKCTKCHRDHMDLQGELKICGLLPTHLQTISNDRSGEEHTSFHWMRGKQSTNILIMKD